MIQSQYQSVLFTNIPKNTKITSTLTSKTKLNETTDMVRLRRTRNPSPALINCPDTESGAKSNSNVRHFRFPQSPTPLFLFGNLVFYAVGNLPAIVVAYMVDYFAGKSHNYDQPIDLGVICGQP